MRNKSNIIAVVLVLATVAFAGDPWKQKAPENWDERDVKKILGDSPWAKEYSVMPTGAIGGDDSPTGVGGSPGGSGTLAGPAVGAGDDLGSGGGGGRGGRRGGGGQGGQNVRPVVYVAQWYSSRTIRAAQIRKSQLSGAAAGENNDALARTPANYEVLLASGDMARFARLGEQGLMKSTYLEIKSSHQRIAPSRVIIIGRGRPIAVAFEFPKTTPTGEPTVAVGEKNVDFVAGGDQLTIKFHYDLTKMVDKQGADL